MSSDAANTQQPPLPPRPPHQDLVNTNNNNTNNYNYNWITTDQRPRPPRYTGGVQHRGGFLPTLGPVALARALLSLLSAPPAAYIRWVRHNPEGASSLERIFRGAIFLVARPGDLVQLEGCWSASNLLGTINDVALSTAGGGGGVNATGGSGGDMSADDDDNTDDDGGGSNNNNNNNRDDEGAVRARRRRREASAAVLTTPQALLFVLRGLQQVECWGELAVRQRWGGERAWHYVIALQAVKICLNVAVNKPLMLLPWMLRSLRRAAVERWRAVGLLGWRRPRHHRNNRSGSSNATITAGDGSGSNNNNNNNGTNSEKDTAEDNLNSFNYAGNGGGGARRLVVPRVIIEEDLEEYGGDSGNTNVNNNNNNSKNEDGNNAEAGNGSSSNTTAAATAGGDPYELPFGFVDVLAVLLDGYLMLRPLIVVLAAARDSRALGPAGASIGMLPKQPTATAAAATATQPQEGGQQQQKEVSAAAAPDIASSGAEVKEKAAPETAAAAGAANPPAGAAEMEEDPLLIVKAAVAARPGRTLMPRWRTWLWLALADFVVLLLARWVRRRRVPIVFIGESSSSGTAGHNHTAAAATDLAADEAAADDDGDNRHNHNRNKSKGKVEISEILPVNSRDALRVQHCIRVLSLLPLRDPFFSTSLKQFLFDHLVVGKINHVPLIGALLAYQVSSNLSMQHYSLLWSTGQ